MTNKQKFIASCSGGKDSVATLILAKEHGEPLDEVVYCEVMFDKETSGEMPEHRDFIYNKLKPYVEGVLGVPWFCPNCSNKEWTHLIFNHEALYDRLLELEGCYIDRARRCLTINETPSELKERVLRQGEQVKLF